MLPELRREKSITTDLERASQIETEIALYENELGIIEERLEKWYSEKNML